MLKLREASAYAPVINQVVGDLLHRLELLRRRSQDGATVPDLPAELYKFGFEGKRSSEGAGGDDGALVVTMSFPACRHLLHPVRDPAGLPEGGHPSTDAALHRSREQHADPVRRGDPPPALDAPRPALLEALR